MDHSNHGHHGHDGHEHHGHNPVIAATTEIVKVLINHTVHDKQMQMEDPHAGHGDHMKHTDHMHGDSSGVSHGMMGHMMSMSFHGGCEETILFEFWQISSLSGLLWSMLVIFLFGMLYEGLKYYREHLFWKNYNALQYRAVSVPDSNGGSVNENGQVVHMVGEVIHKEPPTICSLLHFYQTFLHLIQVTLSFMLMLIFMTFNSWLCLSVVLGAGAGFFLFGHRCIQPVNVTEHCH